MKRGARCGLKCLLPLLAGLAAILLRPALERSRPLPDARTRRVIGNPDQFHLWATNRSYGLAFTYDPHAADDWLFESAAVGKYQAPALLRPAGFASSSKAIHQKR